MSCRRITDTAGAWVFRTCALAAAGVAVFLATCLFLRARTLLGSHSIWSLISSSDWQPHKHAFGFLPYIVGTLAVTFAAMVMAIPVGLLAATYLAEHASARLRVVVKPVIDVLAAIPSVIYGIWGVLVIVPGVQWLAARVGVPCTGYSLLAAGVVLAVMVFPVLISVVCDVLHAVPIEAREAALALGATRWETTWHVVLKQALPGIVAAVVLAFSRAIGETMAVMMVSGNVPVVPRSLFSPVYALPALIANNYGEMMSIPHYDAALMTAALMLFAVVAVFNAIAHIVLHHFEQRWQ